MAHCPRPSSKCIPLDQFKQAIDRSLKSSRYGKILFKFDASRFGPQDYVFCTLKSHQAYTAAPSMLPLLGADTAVVTAMNGIPWWYFYKEGSSFEGTHLRPPPTVRDVPFLLKAIAARSWARQDPTVPTRPPVGAAGDRAKNPSQNGLSLPSAGKPRGTPLDASPARKPRPSLDVAHFGDHASPSIDLGA